MSLGTSLRVEVPRHASRLPSDPKRVVQSAEHTYVGNLRTATDPARTDFICHIKPESVGSFLGLVPRSRYLEQVVAV